MADFLSSRGFIVEGKTKVYVIKGSGIRRGMKAGFVNGDIFMRPRGTTKAFVYHFDGAGNLLISLVPIKQIIPAEFQLEG